MPIPEVNSSLFPDGLNNFVFDRMRVLKVIIKLKIGLENSLSSASLQKSSKSSTLSE